MLPSSKSREKSASAALSFKLVMTSIKGSGFVSTVQVAYVGCSGRLSFCVPEIHGHDTVGGKYRAEDAKRPDTLVKKVCHKRRRSLRVIIWS